MKVIDAESIKKDFPLLSRKINGKTITYLDSAATSQKPNYVINGVSDFYMKYNANVHRGAYKLAEESTEMYESSREEIAKFINAYSSNNIIFTRNTTESINLAALSWGEQNIKKNDHILVTEMEHHSNLLPWMMLAKRKGAVLDYVKVDKEKGLLNEESFEEKLKNNPKLVAISQSSNVLGNIIDVKKFTKRAHNVGAKVMVDGAQSVPHMPVDVKDIDCDFLAFSGHKMLAYTGIGVLYAKEELLNEMEPLFGGGEMILSVGYHDFVPNEIPWKFEAGTPNIEGAISLKLAIDYLKEIGMNNIKVHEEELTQYAIEEISKIKNVKIYGPLKKGEHSGIVSFSIEKIHPHDIATIFDKEGIAIRAGHHCAMPLVNNVLNQPALARMSFYIYNDEKDIDKAIDAIKLCKKTFNIG
ncbi:MAG: aminotransferase class V-fold PLP-dependent enzyme [Candidatus Micrarchaeia archaeon]